MRVCSRSLDTRSAPPNDSSQPPGQVVATQIAEAVRAPVVRFELRMADRPATVVDPLAILEIHRIQRPALPAPAGRAPPNLRNLENAVE